MQEKNILFIARPQLITDIHPFCQQEGIKVGIVDNLQAALKFIQKNQPILVFSEPQLPGYRIEDLLKALTENDIYYPPVIAFTEKGTASEAKRLMEMGAKDYWLAPITWDRLSALLGGQTDEEKSLSKKNKAKKSGEIIGEHSSVKKALELARQVAPSKATVLILGDSGTGKELFAQYIHMQSNRRNKPFVAINCAALPEHLLESELFGHEKGAFTGAVQRKAGKFELASGGTLLLDEISEMDLSLQAKLLRVLQEEEFERVGGMETIRVDLRIIATTNRDLEDFVAQGKFRQDLFFRLNVIPVKLPGLKEREDDVFRLARYFIQRFCREYQVPVKELSAEAMSWLRQHEWKGNVRELQNLMERAVLLSGQSPIQVKHFLMDNQELDFEENEQDVEVAPAMNEEELEQGSLMPEDSTGIIPLQELEKRMIFKSLNETQGNRTQAAKLLGISVRTLRNKLNEYRQSGEVI